MQLPPLGYGCIFSDILNRLDIFTSIQLTKVMRQAEKSGILSDANLIRDGINPIKSPELKIIHGELKDMYYMFRSNRETIQNIAIKTIIPNRITHLNLYKINISPIWDKKSLFFDILIPPFML